MLYFRPLAIPRLNTGVGDCHLSTHEIHPSNKQNILRIGNLKLMNVAGCIYNYLALIILRARAGMELFACVCVCGGGGGGGGGGGVWHHVPMNFHCPTQPSLVYTHVLDLAHWDYCSHSCWYELDIYCTATYQVVPVQNIPPKSVSTYVPYLEEISTIHVHG